jgi:hypothetical protein
VYDVVRPWGPNAARLGPRLWPRLWPAVRQPARVTRATRAPSLDSLPAKSS